MPWFAYAMVAWFIFGCCTGVARSVGSPDPQARSVAVGTILVTLLLIWGTIALAT